MQNLLDGKVDDRTWFQTKEQRKEEKQKLKKKLQGSNFHQNQKKKKQAMEVDPAEAKEMKQMWNEAESTRDSQKPRGKSKEDSFLH